MESESDCQFSESQHLRAMFYSDLHAILEDSGTCSFPSLPSKPGNRFRGITKHKRTQRYEAHFWEQKKQVYLGSFQCDTHAAKSHDIMAIRCKGMDCDSLNFSLDVYSRILPYLMRMSQEDVVAELRHFSKDQAAKLRALMDTAGHSATVTPKKGHESASPRFGGSSFSRGLGPPLRVTPCKAPFSEPGLSDAFQRVVDPPTLVLDPSSEQASPSSVLQSLSLNSVLGKRENPDFGVDSVWPLKLEAEHDLLMPLHSAEHSYLFYDEFVPLGTEGSMSSTEHIDGTAIIHQEPGPFPADAASPAKRRCTDAGLPFGQFNVTLSQCGSVSSWPASDDFVCGAPAERKAADAGADRRWKGPAPAVRTGLGPCREAWPGLGNRAGAVIAAGPPDRQVPPGDNPVLKTRTPSFLRLPYVREELSTSPAPILVGRTA